MSAEEHTTKDLEAMGHKPSSSEDGEGGKCLWGHGDSYKRRPGYSCSYRWQSHLHCLEEGVRVYYHNYPLFPEPAELLVVERKKPKKPTSFKTKVTPPRRLGDWNVDGPYQPLYFELGSAKKRKEVRVKKGENFFNAGAPYWNQAHHLISKGTLVPTIERASAGKSGLAESIKTNLLRAKYNVHGRINMMFLPMDQEIASILRLPRHIQLQYDDGPTDPKGYNRYTNHEYYNAKVASGLTKVVNDYIAALPEMKGKHPKYKGELAKEKLEKLSQELFSFIVDKGESGNGESLDKIAADDGATLSA